MGRPSKSTPPDQFSSGEVAHGSGLSARNFALLHERGLGPQPVRVASGKAGHGGYDSDGLAHAALIGALHKGGIELMLAARLADAVGDELCAAYGRLPSKLDAYLVAPLNPTPGQSPWTQLPEDEALAADTREAFWLHHLLRSRSEIYRSGAAMEGDFVIEIADRRYAFIAILGADPANGLQSSQIEPAYRIEAWGRDRDAIVTAFHAEAGNLDFRKNPAGRTVLKRVEQEFQAARSNAIGLLRINISLAIRNAFDAIHDQRLGKHAAFDWAASVRPPIGRYAGCDEQGYPLDPEHPWNRDLPPVERSARMAEIEAYIAEREGSPLS